MRVALRSWVTRLASRVKSGTVRRGAIAGVVGSVGANILTEVISRSLAAAR
jgi:hypothetical protein